MGTATVERVRCRCLEEGVDAALGRREQLRRRQREARWPKCPLIAMAISDSRRDVSMQMLADGLVEREIVDSISPETVRRTLKKTKSLGEGVLVPPAPRQRRIRVRHGGRAGGLSS